MSSLELLMGGLERVEGCLGIALLDLGVLEMRLDADELLVLLAPVGGPLGSTALELGGEEGLVRFER